MTAVEDLVILPGVGIGTLRLGATPAQLLRECRSLSVGASFDVSRRMLYSGCVQVSVDGDYHAAQSICVHVQRRCRVPAVLSFRGAVLCSLGASSTPCPLTKLHEVCGPTFRGQWLASHYAVNYPGMAFFFAATGGADRDLSTLRLHCALVYSGAHFTSMQHVARPLPSRTLPARLDVTVSDTDGVTVALQRETGSRSLHLSRSRMCDVVWLLGPPAASEACATASLLRIHRLAATPIAEDAGVVHSYPRVGVDVLADGATGALHAMVLHSGVPGSAGFPAYTRLPMAFHVSCGPSAGAEQYSCPHVQRSGDAAVSASGSVDEGQKSTAEGDAAPAAVVAETSESTSRRGWSAHFCDACAHSALAWTANDVAPFGPAIACDLPHMPVELHGVRGIVLEMMRVDTSREAGDLQRVLSRVTLFNVAVPPNRTIEKLGM